MNRFRLLLALLGSLLLTAVAVPAAASPAIYDVRTAGAVGDGTTLDTKALQTAIDQASAAGGGTVVLAGGRFLTGTLYLKSNVTLRIEAGATLLGSPNLADYPTDTMRNVQFTTLVADARPAVVFADVTDASVSDAPAPVISAFVPPTPEKAAP